MREATSKSCVLLQLCDRAGRLRIHAMATGYPNTGNLPFPTRQDEVHHKGLPPECLLRLRRHLSRYPQGALPSLWRPIPYDIAAPSELSLTRHPQDAWSPVLTLKSTLISLQSLLCSPEPNDPQDAEVAKHYTTSKRSFDETAAYWTHIYAGGPPPKGKAAAGDDIAMAGLDPVHVKKFEGMGFTRGAVVSRLCLLG